MKLDVESLHTAIPSLLGLPALPVEHTIVEGLVIRPVSRAAPWTWTMKRNSWRYLEGCPNELRKWLNSPTEVAQRCETLRSFYLSLCRRPRLDAVLSKRPELSNNELAVAEVMTLFREDLEAAFLEKVRGVLGRPHGRDLDAAWADAAPLVAAWLDGRMRATETSWITCTSHTVAEPPGPGVEAPVSGTRKNERCLMLSLSSEGRYRGFSTSPALASLPPAP